MRKRKTASNFTLYYTAIDDASLKDELNIDGGNLPPKGTAGSVTFPDGVVAEYRTREGGIFVSLKMSLELSGAVTAVRHFCFKKELPAWECLPMETDSLWLESFRNGLVLQNGFHLWFGLRTLGWQYADMTGPSQKFSKVKSFGSSIVPVTILDPVLKGVTESTQWKIWKPTGISPLHFIQNNQATSETLRSIGLSILSCRYREAR